MKESTKRSDIIFNLILIMKCMDIKSKVPLHEAIKPEFFKVVTREIFGPLQVIVEYNDDEIDHVLCMLEGMEANLTAAVVSNDVKFQQKILGSTVNGTTYCGIR